MVGLIGRSLRFVLICNTLLHFCFTVQSFKFPTFSNSYFNRNGFPRGKHFSGVSFSRKLLVNVNTNTLLARLLSPLEEEQVQRNAVSVPFYEQTGQSNWTRCGKDLDIILIGNPMVGKSTMANIVSRKMNMTMVDVDDHVHIIGRFAPDDAHARVLESILNREHHTTRMSCGGIVVACGGYMINRQDVVSVLLRAKREGHMIVHLQRQRFWQSASKGRSYYGWPFVDLSYVPFIPSKLGEAPNVMSSKVFTPDKLKQLTERIYATRPEDKELKSGIFTPYFPGRVSRRMQNTTSLLASALRWNSSVSRGDHQPTATTAIGSHPPPSRSAAIGDNKASDNGLLPAIESSGAGAAAAASSDPGAKTRAWLAEQMESAAFSEQIEALYRKARSHQFYAIYDDTRSMKGNAELAARDFYSLVYRVARQNRCPVARGGLVVSLTSKTITELLVPGWDRGIDRLTELLTGAEAVELRVDMLAASSYASREFLKGQYGLLRRHCPLPVIWTVRSAGQGGEFRGGEDEYLLLVKLGAELGAEYMDVEACWSEAGRLSLIRSRRHAIVISSFTATRESLWSAEQLAARLAEMAGACEGRSDVVKLVVESSDPNQAPALAAALEAHRRAWPCTPAVGLCVGKHYAQSLVENPVMGFVSLYSPRGLPPVPREVFRRRLSAGLARPARLSVPPDGPALTALPAALKASGLEEVFEVAALDAPPAAPGAGDAAAGTAAAATAALWRDDAAGVVAVGGGAAGLAELADRLTPAAAFIGEADVLRLRPLAAGPAGARAAHGDNAEWAGLRAVVRAAALRLGGARAARVAVVGGGAGLRACLYALESLPDADVAKPVALYCLPPTPAGAGPAQDLAFDFPSCNAIADGPAALADAAAALASSSDAPAFDVVVSFLPAAAHAAIPDALLAPPAPAPGPAAAAVTVVEPREFGGASPLAARCRAAGAAYVGGADVAREACGVVAARIL